MVGLAYFGGILFSVRNKKVKIIKKDLPKTDSTGMMDIR
jgi:hypothetical protein